ncbi:VQ motif-containing protein 8, chloroplastic-like [Herrania umbratica]|uniref:VQ motif-containing protein 8, chloroplastic-like n=1 Tax=Herrania umbratica TaxID=108875 RepID=A0A6J1AU79_9ROSI|nr:VQ motif-containing protein 8, chloroplastic-like [Herrania umbratica]
MMSSSNDTGERNSTRRRDQLQGPRPAPLKVFNSSSKMKKSSHPDRSKINPVVIYLRSPKIIHVRPEEFMSLVQSLTGKDSTTIQSYPSSPSASSCDLAADESMSKRSHNLFDAEIMKPFNEVDFGDQFLGMSPTWLRFLAPV